MTDRKEKDLSGTYLDSRGKPFTATLTDTGYYKITDPSSEYVFWTHPDHAAIYVNDGTWRPTPSHPSRRDTTGAPPTRRHDDGQRHPRGNRHSQRAD